ncbi:MULTISPECIES: NblA/ycf18 family protein [unclassified Microcoleus]|uniref:NblA/ycf18 family protein n=1 Tax=unclassified Microcoleus TaxID=2642155 RepID=UPI002FD03306
MKTETSLTVEQQFKLKVYANQTLSLSAEQSRLLLVEMMRQNMIKDNEIKNLLNPNPNE